MWASEGAAWDGVNVRGRGCASPGITMLPFLGWQTWPAYGRRAMQARLSDVADGGGAGRAVERASHAEGGESGAPQTFLRQNGPLPYAPAAARKGQRAPPLPDRTAFTSPSLQPP